MLVSYGMASGQGDEADVELAPRVVVSRTARFGRPRIRGTRVPLDAVLGQLAAGLSVEQVMEEYGLERDDVLAALSYAADTLANDPIRAG